MLDIEEEKEEKLTIEMEAKVRNHIARELWKRISNGVVEFSSKDFAQIGDMPINIGSIKRYIIRAPLFDLVVLKDDYPVYIFLLGDPNDQVGYAKLRGGASRNWKMVLKKTLTPKVLSRWMKLRTKEATRQRGDPAVMEKAIIKFSKFMCALRFQKMKTDEMIDSVNEHIHELWDVAYGYKQGHKERKPRRTKGLPEVKPCRRSIFPPLKEQAQS